MSDDPKEKQPEDKAGNTVPWVPDDEYRRNPARDALGRSRPSRTVETSEVLSPLPSNTVPFVPHDDYSMNPHIYARRPRPNAAVLDTANQVVLPRLPIRSGKAVRYVDFGFTAAKEFWAEVVLPAYECFKAEPSRGKAIIAALAAWHIQD
jgi:hypothetical protein